MAEPVRDLHGWTVWRVRVTAGELTCQGCGETFAAGEVCPRCGLMENGVRRRELPPAVETVSYLRDGEWEMGGQ
jgi:hypothetical protein